MFARTEGSMVLRAEASLLIPNRLRARTVIAYVNVLAPLGLNAERPE